MSFSVQGMENTMQNCSLRHSAMSSLSVMRHLIESFTFFWSLMYEYNNLRLLFALLTKSFSNVTIVMKVSASSSLHFFLYARRVNDLFAFHEARCLNHSERFSLVSFLRALLNHLGPDL